LVEVLNALVGVERLNEETRKMKAEEEVGVAMSVG
jgi:hypothetical protein